MNPATVEADFFPALERHRRPPEAIAGRAVRERLDYAAREQRRHARRLFQRQWLTKCRGLAYLRQLFNCPAPTITIRAAVKAGAVYTPATELSRTKWATFVDRRLVVVTAPTKSEARAALKKQLGVKRLPPGVALRRLTPNGTPD